MAKKQSRINRENAAKVLSVLSKVRGECSDMAAKRRLRTAEEKLAVAAPAESFDAEFIDNELLKLLEEFLSVSTQGILTERYLDRIESLLAQRSALS